MPTLIESLVPSFVAKELFKLSLAERDMPRAYNVVDLKVETSGEALIYGVSPQIEMTVTPPDPEGFTRQLFRKLPNLVSFTPKEGGPHLVVIREVGHNLWWGRLVVDVAGQRLEVRR